MKKSILFIVIAFVGGMLNGIAQQPSEKLKQIFLDAEYFYLYEDFEEALYSYNTLYKRGYADNGNINYRIGQCYLNIPGEKNKAIPYLLKATSNADAKYTEGSFKETKAPFDAFYFLGIAYRINNQLVEADSSYYTFKKLVGPKNIQANMLVDAEITSVANAREAMKNPSHVVYKNLERPVSTSSRDLFPAVSGNESVIVYNSAQKFYDAVFFSKKVNNKWTSPINITPEIQSDGNQYVSSLSFDGNELYLRYEDNFEADIMVAKYEDGRWNKSKSLNRNVNTKFFEGNACVTKDGKTLYFSSNKSGGTGALDIYKSSRMPNGEWSEAENLGSKINTNLNEDAPIISEDGKILFFTSQGHNTMGGYDIFYSEMDSFGKWKAPVNLGYPVNTTDDNTSFYPLYNGAIGYTSLYASTGFGREDIFKVTISEPKIETQVADIVKDTVAEINEIPKEVVAVQPEIKRELPADVEKIMTETIETEKDKENIVLRSLFFDFNSFDLTEVSMKELDHLVMVLSNYTDLKIQFIGNTDAIGGDKYNNLLSERRAASVKKYLISKGISENRLQIKGVGEKNNVAVNNNPDGSDNPDGRKFNRRVDIHLLSAKPQNIIVEPAKVPDNLKVK